MSSLYACQVGRWQNDRGKERIYTIAVKLGSLNALKNDIFRSYFEPRQGKPNFCGLWSTLN